jgi:hypothetical protein
MSDQKTITVQATITDAKHDIVRNVILVNALVEGQPRSMVLGMDAVGHLVPAIKDMTDRSKVQEIMGKCAEALAQRSHPINLELAENQLSGDKEGSQCTIQLQ